MLERYRRPFCFNVFFMNEKSLHTGVVCRLHRHLFYEWEDRTLQQKRWFSRWKWNENFNCSARCVCCQWMWNLLYLGCLAFIQNPFFCYVQPSLNPQSVTVDWLIFASRILFNFVSVHHENFKFPKLRTPTNASNNTWCLYNSDSTLAREKRWFAMLRTAFDCLFSFSQGTRWDYELQGMKQQFWKCNKNKYRN